MSRNKLKDFLNQKYGANAPNMISMVSDVEDSGKPDRLDYGDDLGVEPGTGDELLSLQSPEEPGGLLGDFVKYIVDLSNHDHPGNQFILEGGNTPAVPSDRGDSLDVTYDGVVKTYVEAVDGVLAQKEKNTLGGVMSSYSQSGYLKGLNLPDLKTGYGEVPFGDDVPDEEVYEMNGNTMLSTIAGEDLSNTNNLGKDNTAESVIEEAVENMLVANSRFRGVSGDRFSSFVDPDEKFSSEFEGPDPSTTSAGTLTSQNLFGEYVKNPKNTGSDANSMAIDQLKTVAASMMLKAAGWDSANTPGDSMDPSEFSPEGRSFALTNGLKVDVDDLRARDAYGAPETDSGDSPRAGRGETISYEGGFSYGSMNTPETPFSDGSSHTVMVAHAAAAIIAMLEISLETFKIVTDNGTYDLARGPYNAGHARLIGRTTTFETFRHLILIPTEHSYSDCVVQGFLVMFNRDIEDANPDETGKSGRDAAGYQGVQESPGFWLAVCRKMLRAFTDFSATVSEDAQSYVSVASEDMWANLYDLIAGNGILRMLNVAAQIGDRYLVSNGGKINGGVAGTITTGPGSPDVVRWNVDALPDGPATRVSKSRSQSGQTALSLAWRGSTAPSIFSIPKNVIFAAFEMGSLGYGTNPAKGMLGSQLIEKTYVDVWSGADAEENVFGISNAPRIPTALIEQIENKFDAEYVPFYFHDLRTNEIVGFHAFLENLTDRISPRYTSVGGYGRIDDVKIYRNTSRSLSFSFYAVATSKEDFDEMWFKINKLTTLAYPSWTGGSTLSANEGKSIFKQPFSQVLGASPLIRLRIGDVIKSNYSRFNLARIFGIGEDGIVPEAPEDAGWLGAQSLTANEFSRSLTAIQFETVFAALYGSPVSFLSLLGDMESGLERTLTSLLTNTLGFTNPLGVSFIMKRLLSPDVVGNAIPSNTTLAGGMEARAGRLSGNDSGKDVWGYKEGNYPYLKASVDDGYLSTDGSGKRIRTVRPIRVKVTGVNTITLPVLAKRKANPKYKTYYTVEVVDPNVDFAYLKNRTEFRVTHEDLTPNYNMLFNVNVLPYLSITAAAGALVQTLAQEAATISGIPSDVISGLISTSDAAAFMSPDHNPITKAFENAGGRGLAGVLTNITYDWLDSQNPWETDWNSRAPMWFKVNLNFDVIHDIPPGLDHNGFNRAPLYNVGDIMQYVAGDPYPDNGQGSKNAYTAAGRLGIVSEEDSTVTGTDAKKSFQD